MLRHVRTAYGDSEDFYTSVGDDLMHGECQGKTSSPPSWAIYTITLIRALGRFNPGITVQCVEFKRLVHRLADCFVDDTDMWTGSSQVEETDEEIPELLQKFRTAAQAWERILFASGGLLALHKCYWWLTSWKWDKGLPVMATVDDDVQPHILALTNGKDATPRTIKRLGPKEANIGLGCRLPPDGNHDDEASFKNDQSDSMAGTINITKLTPTEAWTLYRSIYIPKVFFSCKITSFSERQWATIMS